MGVTKELYRKKLRKEKGEGKRKEEDNEEKNTGSSIKLNPVHNLFNLNWILIQFI